MTCIRGRTYSNSSNEDFYKFSGDKVVSSLVYSKQQVAVLFFCGLKSFGKRHLHLLDIHYILNELGLCQNKDRLFTKRQIQFRGTKGQTFVAAFLGDDAVVKEADPHLSMKALSNEINMCNLS